MGMDAPAVEKPAFKKGGETMTLDDQKPAYKKFIFFMVGMFILVLGITLVLIWWKDVVILFKGAIGVILALAGLVTLYAMSKNNR